MVLCFAFFFFFCKCQRLSFKGWLYLTCVSTPEIDLKVTGSLLLCLSSHDPAFPWFVPILGKTEDRWLRTWLVAARARTVTPIAPATILPSGQIWRGRNLSNLGQWDFLWNLQNLPKEQAPFLWCACNFMSTWLKVESFSDRERQLGKCPTS